MSTKQQDWKKVREAAGPYPLPAYQFVREGLAHTASMTYGPAAHGTTAPKGHDANGGVSKQDHLQSAADDEGSIPVEGVSQDVEDTGRNESRHVSGQQLCMGLRDFAICQYGMLAKAVLGRWHITSTYDFGKIVFAMIDAGFMHKTDQDDIEDFVDVFDFDEAFADLARTR